MRFWNMRFVEIALTATADRKCVHLRFASRLLMSVNRAGFTAVALFLSILSHGAYAGQITYDFVDPATGTNGYNVLGSIAVDSTGISAAPIDLTSTMILSWHISVFDSSNVLQLSLASTSDRLFLTGASNGFTPPLITLSSLYLPVLPDVGSAAAPSLFSSMQFHDPLDTVGFIRYSDDSTFVEYFREAASQFYTPSITDLYESFDFVHSTFTVAVARPASVVPESSSLVIAVTLFGSLVLAGIWRHRRRRQRVPAAIFMSCVAMLGGTGAANAALIPSLFGTGVDNNGVSLPDGPIGAGAIGDPHYSLVSVPAGGATQIDVYTFNQGHWVPGDANSTWIAPNSAAPGFVQAGPEGNYDYRTTFSLAGFDPATASIIGKWAADNHGFDILINGHSTGNTTETTTSDSFTTLHDFSISGNFGAGLNTLDFLVNNSNGPGPNPTGLRVEILDATADPAAGRIATPEPSSLIILSSFLVMAGVVWCRQRLARSTAAE